MTTKQKLKEIKVEEVKTKSVMKTDESTTSAKTFKAPKKPAVRCRSHFHGHGKQSNKVVVKKDKEIVYVSRDDAVKMVKSGWQFGKKSEWKKNVRDVK